MSFNRTPAPGEIHRELSLPVRVPDDGDLEHGSKGVLRDRRGRTGALFTVVAIGKEAGVGRITEYAPGFFNRDPVDGVPLGYLAQVLRGTGFADLSLLNPTRRSRNQRGQRVGVGLAPPR